MEKLPDMIIQFKNGASLGFKNCIFDDESKENLFNAILGIDEEIETIAISFLK